MAKREDRTPSEHAWHGSVRSIRCSIFGIASLGIGLLLSCAENERLIATAANLMALYPLALFVGIVIYAVEGRKSESSARKWAIGLIWGNVLFIAFGPMLLIRLFN